MHRSRKLALYALLLSACGNGRPSPEGLPDIDAAARDAASRETDSQAAALPDAHSDTTTQDGGRDTDVARDAQTRELRLPPANGGLDYQLGGAYPPPAGVAIVSRDRKAPPAAGLYNVCYVNGFQAQAEEADFWLREQADLVLRNGKGDPVIDPDWNEMLLDVGSADKRTRLAVIVGAWIEGCADAGYDAVEIDNLDTYSRSGGALREDDAVAFIALLSTRAHARGLAIAQKNSSELAHRKAQLGTDFVVSEECARYQECDAYIEAYGEHVLMIEYRRADFQSGCAQHPDYSIVLRDLNLSTPQASSYVFENC
jgi:Glycoside-hydrolase family GH114